MDKILADHEGSRGLQEAFGSTALADRLSELARREFSDEDRAYIEGSIYFFLATADAEGQPDVSFKGGPAGFVRVTGPAELAFPDYDGNGMFKSLGNLEVNEKVGLLFISMHGRPRRLRIVERATVLKDDPLMAEMVGAQMIVRVAVEGIFPNCPRYIPKLELEAESKYAPVAGEEPVEPAWKTFDVFSDVTPPRRPTYKG